MSEASIRTQWKKGQSGNPKGRPKRPKPLNDQGGTVTYYARWLLDQPCYLLGGGRPVTRQTRFLLDILERAERGELPAVKLLFDFADRGDRRRMQALRAARRAKTEDEAKFERRNAERVSPRTPGLRSDEEHLIKPARELRTEHLKPVKKAAPKKGEYEFDHWRQPDPLAGIPKHLSQEERDRRDELALAAIAAIPPAPAQEANLPPQTRAETAPETAPTTAPGTGVKTGPITGPENRSRAHQTIDAAFESKIRTSDSKNFVVPGSVDGASIDGAHRNGSPV